jgi:hypothetical protein
MAALIFEVLFCRWLATKWKPTSTSITIAAGIAALIGPACGLLPYTDYMPLFLKDLAFVWVTAAIGVVSIGIGAFAIIIGSKVAGTICVVTNIPVLLYWGFVPEQRPVFLRKWYREFHRKWVFTNTTS